MKIIYRYATKNLIESNEIIQQNGNNPNESEYYEK